MYTDGLLVVYVKGFHLVVQSEFPPQNSWFKSGGDGLQWNHD